MNIHLWNQAVLLKILWSVTTKKDCLQIKWLHEYYIKNASVEICVIPVTATWVVRKIVESRRYIAQLHTIPGGFEAKLKLVVNNENFSIKKMYHLLLPTYQKVEWKSIALQQHIHPQHRFIFWLAAQRRLATVDRLNKFGIQVPMQCIFCDSATETLYHLFFECYYTKQLWARLLQWLGIRRTIGIWHNELQWVNQCEKRRTGQGVIVSCVFSMMIVLIWKERNNCRFQQRQVIWDKICRKIIVHVHVKGCALQIWSTPLASLDRFS